MNDAPPPELLETIGNLSEFHREHEKFYAQAPLRQAVQVEAASRVLKALGDHWSSVSPTDRPGMSPFAGAPDLNPPGLTAEASVLFMEGEGEPTEIKQLRRDLETLAGDMEAGGEWLSAAMEKGWAVAGSLAAYPELADLLGERHRIVANDWQAANGQALIARLLRRALEIIDRVDFSPAALRADLAGERTAPAYLDNAILTSIEHTGLTRENQRDNDTDRYVLAAQSRQVAGAAERKARARSPSRKPAYPPAFSQQSPYPGSPDPTAGPKQRLQRASSWREGRKR